MILRCTQKLLTTLKKTPDTVALSISPFGSWHANLLTIDRRKCVLVTNDTSLYTVFIPYLTAQEFKMFDAVFGQALFKSLMNEGLPQKSIEKVLDETREIIYSKTNNRVVLGCMNDQKHMIEHHIAFEGGLDNADISEVNKSVNRNILSSIEYNRPIEQLKKMLEGQK